MQTLFSRRGKWFQYQIPADDHGKPVKDIFKERFHISGRMLQSLTRKKGLRLNRKPTHLKATVKEGDQLAAAVFEAEDYGLPPRPLDTGPLDILYEDEHVIVINKPAGVAIHPVHPDEQETLAHAVADYYSQTGQAVKVRFVHRLDRDTSGAILVAKHRLAHGLLDQQLRDHTLQRRYEALIHGLLTEEKGSLQYPVTRVPGHPVKRMVDEKGEAAVTHFEVIGRRPANSQFPVDVTRVRCTLETGRTHQIRVHFSHIGHPLLGDTLYGGRKDLIKRQALHAESLRFIHPFSGETVSVHAPLPEDWNRLIEALK